MMIYSNLEADGSAALDALTVIRSRIEAMQPIFPLVKYEQCKAIDRIDLMLGWVSEALQAYESMVHDAEASESLMDDLADEIDELH